MSSNVIFFGWNRSIPGREQTSAQHFQDFVQYVGGLQQAGTIQSWDAVFLNQHGGDMNGFFLIRGEPDKLSAVVAGEEWMKHMTRASLHLEGSGSVQGATGDLVMQRMQTWTSLLPG
jgi:hypothetical protein